MQTFGVGIIGFGFMGRTHSYGHVNMPLYYDPPPCRTCLVGVATSRRETAEAARQALGFECATDDWQELIARADVDLIHVCTPNKFHKEQVLAALAAGKHVYCDKPLCMDRAEAAEIAAALPSARVTHQMALHSRFFPATLRAKQLAEESFLGELLSFRGAYLHAGSADPKAPPAARPGCRLRGEHRASRRQLRVHMLHLSRTSPLVASREAREAQMASLEGQRVRSGCAARSQHREGAAATGVGRPSLLLRRAGARWHPPHCSARPRRRRPLPRHH